MHGRAVASGKKEHSAAVSFPLVTFREQLPKPGGAVSCFGIKKEKANRASPRDERKGMIAQMDITQQHDPFCGHRKPEQSSLVTFSVPALSIGGCGLMRQHVAAEG